MSSKLIEENQKLHRQIKELLDELNDIERFIPCHCREKHGDNEQCPALIFDNAIANIFKD